MKYKIIMPASSSIKQKIDPDRFDLKNLEKWYDRSYCLRKVKQNPRLYFPLCKKQTSLMCEIAIKYDRKLIEYVDIKQFPDIYLLYKLLYS